MATQKITVTLPRDLLAAVRDLAGPGGVSAWLTDTARARVLDEAARAAGDLFRSPGGELVGVLRHAAHRRAEQLDHAGA